MSELLVIMVVGDIGMTNEWWMLLYILLFIVLLHVEQISPDFYCPGWGILGRSSVVRKDPLL